jgi:hypothetical protein
VSNAGDIDDDGVADLSSVLTKPILPARPISCSGGNTGAVGNFPAELELASLLAANGGDGSAGVVLENTLPIEPRLAALSATPETSTATASMTSSWARRT